jgi:hypothetical protein
VIIVCFVLFYQHGCVQACRHGQVGRWQPRGDATVYPAAVGERQVSCAVLSYGRDCGMIVRRPSGMAWGTCWRVVLAVAWQLHSRVIEMKPYAPGWQRWCIVVYEAACEHTF